MKRRFAKRVSGEYFQKEISDDFFYGYITCTKINNIDKPFFVNNGLYDFCIIDNNYTWYGMYPKDGHYAITIMFDDKDNLIQCYFDISKEVGLENGICYEDDLFLDMLITKEGDKLILDEDELLEARDKGEITQNDVDFAYNVLKELEVKYYDNFDELNNYIDKIKKEFV